MQLTNVQWELPLVCFGVNSNSRAPQFESINDRIQTRKLSLRTRGSWRRQRRTHEQIFASEDKPAHPQLQEDFLSRVYSSSSSPHHSSFSYSSSSIYEYTSRWVYRPQFPEQSVLPFSIFPASDLPSCIYDVPLTCILLLLPLLILFFFFFFFFFFCFMVRITATHLSALSLAWTAQQDHPS
jgi:hypothetical protein